MLESEKNYYCIPRSEVENEGFSNYLNTAILNLKLAFENINYVEAPTINHLLKHKLCELSKDLLIIKRQQILKPEFIDTSNDEQLYQIQDINGELVYDQNLTYDEAYLWAEIDAGKMYVIKPMDKKEGD